MRCGTGFLAALLALSVSQAAVAAEGGLADAQAAIQAKDYQRAIELLKPLANAGNVAASRDLAGLYYNGNGTTADPQKALDLLLPPAQAGDGLSEFDVATIYHAGHLGSVDDAEAAKWFRAAADRGIVRAASELGFLYNIGHGVPVDGKEATRWTVKAAAQGYAPALVTLGTQFARGFGVPRDDGQALFWTEAALARIPASDPKYAEAQGSADRIASRLGADQAQKIVAAGRAWTPSKGAFDSVLASAGLPPEGPAGTVAPAGSAAKVTGSGFVVNAAGDVVTNNHVVETCSGGIRLRLANGTAITASVTAADRTGDLAVLHPLAPLGEPVVLADRPARQGETVVAAGFPLAGVLTSDMTVSQGIVAALSGLGDNARQLQISAPIQSGNSGGPVFGPEGTVIGVVQSALAPGAHGTVIENANFAIKASAVREFLDARAVPYQSATAAKGTESLADRARRSTVFVECRR